MGDIIYGFKNIVLVFSRYFFGGYSTLLTQNAIVASADACDAKA
jgi:hypothetical protein